jgi:hypothetical protein
VTPGSIIFYKKFTFKDGDQSDKLLIVLNSGKNKPYLVVRTTSKQKGKQQKEGCHPSEGYYFLPAKRDDFPGNTWILLYDFYELSTAEFLKAHFDGVAEIKGTLKPETVRALINCAKKGQDWSGHYEGLVS